MDPLGKRGVREKRGGRMTASGVRVAAMSSTIEAACGKKQMGENKTRQMILDGGEVRRKKQERRGEKTYYASGPNKIPLGKKKLVLNGDAKEGAIESGIQLRGENPLPRQILKGSVHSASLRKKKDGCQQDEG